MVNPNIVPPKEEAKCEKRDRRRRVKRSRAKERTQTKESKKERNRKKERKKEERFDVYVLCFVCSTGENSVFGII